MHWKLCTKWQQFCSSLVVLNRFPFAIFRLQALLWESLWAGHSELQEICMFCLVSQPKIDINAIQMSDIYCIYSITIHWFKNDSETRTSQLNGFHSMKFLSQSQYLFYLCLIGIKFPCSCCLISLFVEVPHYRLSVTQRLKPWKFNVLWKQAWIVIMRMSWHRNASCITGPLWSPVVLLTLTWGQQCGWP